MLDTDPWPLVLLVLRVATVGLLYLFLLTAFRALRADLRADLRASSAPQRARTDAPFEGVSRGAAAGAAGRALPSARAAAPNVEDTWDAEDGWEDEGWEQGELPLRGDAGAQQRSGVRPRVWLPVTAAILVVAFGGTAMLLADQSPTGGNAPVAAVETTADGPFEPPTVAPEPGQVTVGLAATEDAQLRVTVDGIVEFEGTLRSGERQAWAGNERIQVWTDSGKTVQLAVNGVDLGAYSPAMGQPDWNRIDFGFWPGWGQ